MTEAGAAPARPGSALVEGGDRDDTEAALKVVHREQLATRSSCGLGATRRDGPGVLFGVGAHFGINQTVSISWDHDRK